MIKLCFSLLLQLVVYALSPPSILFFNFIIVAMGSSVFMLYCLVLIHITILWPIYSSFGTTAISMIDRFVFVSAPTLRCPWSPLELIYNHWTFVFLFSYHIQLVRILRVYHCFRFVYFNWWLNYLAGGGSKWKLCICRFPLEQFYKFSQTAAIASPFLMKFLLKVENIFVEGGKIILKFVAINFLYIRAQVLVVKNR